MKIGTRIWFIVFGMLISLGFVIGMLLITLDNSNQSLIEIQQRTQSWSALKLQWEQQEIDFVAAQDDARDMALTAHGDPESLKKTTETWVAQMDKMRSMTAEFPATNGAIAEALTTLLTSLDESIEMQTPLFEAWESKDNFKTRKHERGLEKSNDQIELDIATTRDLMTAYLETLQNQSSETISKRFSQVLMLVPIVLIGVIVYAALIVRRIRTSLKNTMSELDRSAMGDMRQGTLNEKSRDELGQMNIAFITCNRI